MNGEGTFNSHILVDKLAKLNSTQQSIETLSHWCIFHRKNAKQVVETWERQFYCSPKDQRVSFLYLANDILQNSRRKGMEFVGEFYKVLPDALGDAIENGGDFGRKTALRLVDIWEERKVFSLRGQTLKEDFLGRNRNGKNISYKLKQPSGHMLEKLTSSYHDVYNGCDEDTLFGKCRMAISSVEKVEKEMGNDLGNITESGVADELLAQQALLKECIEQMKAAESSRTTLVSHLREALNEQEFKIEELRTQLQVAQVRYDQIGSLLLGQAPALPLPCQNINEIPPPPPASAYSEAPPPPDFPPESPTNPTVEKSLPTNGEQQTVASNASGQSISYVLSSLVSDGVIGQPTSEDDHLDASKRPRLNNGNVGNVPCFLPQPMLSPTLPLVAPFTYGSPPVQPMPGFPVVGIPPYPGPMHPFPFQGSDGGFFVQPQYPAGLPPSSQQ